MQHKGFIGNGSKRPSQSGDMRERNKDRDRETQTQKHRDTHRDRQTDKESRRAVRDGRGPSKWLATGDDVAAGAQPLKVD